MPRPNRTNPTTSSIRAKHVGAEARTGASSSRPSIASACSASKGFACVGFACVAFACVGLVAAALAGCGSVRGTARPLIGERSASDERKGDSVAVESGADGQAAEPVAK